MEPALSKRIWRCPLWMRFVHERQVAASPDYLNTVRSFEELGHVITIKAVGYPASKYPPTFTYTLDGVRLTPAKFADAVNWILTLNVIGVKPRPYSKEPPEC